MRSTYSHLTNLFRDAGYNSKLHKNAYKMLLLLYRLHIFAADQIKAEKQKEKKIEQLSLEKATFWEISSNLWQALTLDVVQNFGPIIKLFTALKQPV